MSEFDNNSDHGAETPSDLRLGHELCARYGNSPGVVRLPGPASVAARVDGFRLRHLPLLANLQRRWSNSSLLPRGWEDPVYAWPVFSRTRQRGMGPATFQAPPPMAARVAFPAPLETAPLDSIVSEAAAPQGSEDRREPFDSESAIEHSQAASEQPERPSANIPVRIGKPVVKRSPPGIATPPKVERAPAEGRSIQRKSEGGGPVPTARPAQMPAPTVGAPLPSASVPHVDLVPGGKADADADMVRPAGVPDRPKGATQPGNNEKPSVSAPVLHPATAPSGETSVSEYRFASTPRAPRELAPAPPDRENNDDVDIGHVATPSESPSTSVVVPRALRPANDDAEETAPPVIAVDTTPPVAGTAANPARVTPLSPAGAKPTSVPLVDFYGTPPDIEHRTDMVIPAVSREEAHPTDDASGSSETPQAAGAEPQQSTAVQRKIETVAEPLKIADRNFSSEASESVLARKAEVEVERTHPALRPAGTEVGLSETAPVGIPAAPFTGMDAAEAGPVDNTEMQGPVPISVAPDDPELPRNPQMVQLDDRRAPGGARDSGGEPIQIGPRPYGQATEQRAAARPEQNSIEGAPELTAGNRRQRRSPDPPTSEAPASPRTTSASEVFPPQEPGTLPNDLSIASVVAPSADRTNAESHALRPLASSSDSAAQAGLKDTGHAMTDVLVSGRQDDPPVSPSSVETAVSIGLSPSGADKHPSLPPSAPANDLVKGSSTTEAVEQLPLSAAALMPVVADPANPHADAPEAIHLEMSSGAAARSRMAGPRASESVSSEAPPPSIQRVSDSTTPPSAVVDVARDSLHVRPNTRFESQSPTATANTQPAGDGVVQPEMRRRSDAIVETLAVSPESSTREPVHGESATGRGREATNAELNHIEPERDTRTLPPLSVEVPSSSSQMRHLEGARSAQGPPAIATTSAALPSSSDPIHPGPGRPAQTKPTSAPIPFPAAALNSAPIHLGPERPVQSKPASAPMPSTAAAPTSAPIHSGPGRAGQTQPASAPIPSPAAAPNSAPIHPGPERPAQSNPTSASITGPAPAPNSTPVHLGPERTAQTKPASAPIAATPSSAGPIDLEPERPALKPPDAPLVVPAAPASHKLPYFEPEHLASNDLARAPMGALSAPSNYEPVPDATSEGPHPSEPLRVVPTQASVTEPAEAQSASYSSRVDAPLDAHRQASNPEPVYLQRDAAGRDKIGGRHAGEVQASLTELSREKAQTPAGSTEASLPRQNTGGTFLDSGFSHLQPSGAPATMRQSSAAISGPNPPGRTFLEPVATQPPSSAAYQTPPPFSNHPTVKPHFETPGVRPDLVHAPHPIQRFPSGMGMPVLSEALGSARGLAANLGSSARSAAEPLTHLARQAGGFAERPSQSASGAFSMPMGTVPSVNAGLSRNKGGAPGLDMNGMVEQVYQMLVRRLDSEKQRKGM